MLSKTLLTASVLYLARSAVAQDSEKTSSTKKPTDGTYDYVIVGGGTGGLAMAARLSENPDVTVAVIEAGSYYQISNPLLSSTPAGDIAWSGSAQKDINPGVDWGFMSAAQSGANGRSIHYPRGKCLGGSSGRNFMIYQRPDKGSLQQWADAVGDDSYTWDKWLPYYKKSVKFSSPGASRFPNATQSYNAGAFEAGGPLRVSYPAWANAFSTWLTKAFEEIGLKSAKDFNSGELYGTGFLSATIDPYNGFRDSSQTSFLETSQGRPNLKVFYLTLAKKIIFEGKAAKGVAVASGITIWAKKEVILSAGAFQTPQLLMVSGVGPAAELKKHNIPLVQELAGVGQNMWDHVFFGPSYEVHTPTLQSVVLNPAQLFVELTQNYFPRAEGILTNPVCDYLGWEKTPRDLITKEAADSLTASFAPSWPEIEYLSCPGYIGNYSSIMDSPTTNVASVVAAIVAPKSRGTVSLKSSDTADLPIIDPKWLTDKADQEVAVASYKRLRKLWATKAMAGNRVNGKEFWPGEKVQTDAQVLNLVRDSMMTIFHASCTAKMGKKEDKMAVLDAQARVYGVRNLRVVDASAFPLLPPGHPQSVVYALAEKIAESIKKGN